MAGSKPSVVLVADRTLCGRYKVLFEGIFATMQTTQVPRLAMRTLLSPPVATDRDGRAETAPLGLRRLEATLLADGGLDESQVVCTTPRGLGQVLGPWVNVVGVSSSDPLGKGMSNTTTTSFWPGELYTSFWMNETMSQVKRAKDKWGFSVIAGGAGAWQYTANRPAAERHGIDTVYEGYFESRGPALIADALAGKPLPAHVTEDGNAIDRVRPIRRAALMGAVELSRGCGKGCSFCTAAHKRMEHLPKELILADVGTNVRLGQPNIISTSEDFFRYGGVGPKVNFATLADLLAEMRRIDGIRFMQIDHGNISSVLQFSLEELREIRRLLSWPSPTDFLWVNMGIESANGALVAATSPGKIAPFRHEDWPAMVEQAAATMAEAGFFPVFSLILGLPGETPADVQATHELVRRLAKGRAVIFPIFHEPLPERNGKSFGVPNMRADHLALYTECYELNFRWVPKLFWDNQRAGGVSWLKRAVLQTLGKTEVRAWRKNFRRLSRRLGQAGTPPAGARIAAT